MFLALMILQIRVFLSESNGAGRVSHSDAEKPLTNLIHQCLIHRAKATAIPMPIGLMQH